MMIERSILSNLHRNLCSGCSLELPGLGNSAILSTHNIGFYEEIGKCIP